MADSDNKLKSLKQNILYRQIFQTYEPVQASLDI